MPSSPASELLSHHHVEHEDDVERIQYFQSVYGALKEELSKSIIGQAEVVDQLLIAIFTRNHALLVGVPGLAKTLLVSSLAKVLELDFKRIQFTPDLMPSDITGTEFMVQDPQTRERGFRFLPGPIFANIILADEINRTPPKTQAALLEAMQERGVSIGGIRHKLPDPFFVLATQNPVEQEGTYPLPEAQLDRFLLMIMVDYPKAEEELEIMKRVTGSDQEEPQPVIKAEHILYLQEMTRRVPVADDLYEYARRLVAATRPEGGETFDFSRKALRWGAGPRASLGLIAAAKAHAILQGRVYVAREDIDAVARPVLRHRIILSFSAQSSGITPDGLIGQIIEALQ